jgi:tRNA 2-selenouridine synthase SelU
MPPMMQTIPIETFLKNMSAYDLIIDARSPLEYGESHVENAVNLYALSDEEHHQHVNEMKDYLKWCKANITFDKITLFENF